MDCPRLPAAAPDLEWRRRYLLHDPGESDCAGTAGLDHRRPAAVDDRSERPLLVSITAAIRAPVRGARTRPAAARRTYPAGPPTARRPRCDRYPPPLRGPRT